MLTPWTCLDLFSLLRGFLIFKSVSALPGSNMFSEQSTEVSGLGFSRRLTLEWGHHKSKGIFDKLLMSKTGQVDRGTQRFCCLLFLRTKKGDTNIQFSTTGSGCWKVG